MSLGKVLLVSHFGLKWQDVLDYEDIQNSIEKGAAFHPKILSFPRCEHWGTGAFAERRSEVSVLIRWPEEDETNKKNWIDTGTMVLTWECPVDVLVTAPYSVTWEPSGESAKIAHLSGFQLLEYFKDK